MFRPPTRWPLLLLLLSWFSCTLGDDLDVLMKVKESLQRSNISVFDSWTYGNSPCNFTGVSCSSPQSVTQVDLSDQRLVGHLPFDYICQLQSLERFNVSFNSLSGSITNDLKNCTKLQVLDLSANSFSEVVPDLSLLTELHDLRLDGNRFTGLFPWKCLENLTNLVVLTLGDNPFDITSFPLQVLKLRKLTRLYLTNSSLEGIIPVGFGNLTEMMNLEFSSNHLTGEIPGDIVKLSKLWQLELYDNRLSGKIPTGFGNLTELRNLDLSNNSLEGDLSELKSLKNIVSLQLFENHLSGNVPDEFGDFKYLQGLSLYKNHLSGSLPRNLGSWSDFYFIDVSENQLSGLIPPNMCKNGKMTDILVVNNRFTGGIPESYSACISLTGLRVSNNSLSGIVPAGIWGLPTVDFIDLAMNQFEGPITSDIGNAKFLTRLRIHNNRFSGNLPAEISKASFLASLDACCNQFSGQIPFSIGALKNLNRLSLQENLLSGTMPESLGQCSSLNIINLAANSLSGRIPATLGSLPSLNSLNLSRNELSSSIPSSLSLLKLSLLDLSNNKLTGRIPKSLSDQTNNSSFIGNPDLCSQDMQYIQLCPDSGKSNRLQKLLSCFLTGTVLLFISFYAFIYIKRRRSEKEKRFKSDDWQIKSFQRMSFCEKEILKLIKQENLIGKGGSGNVYRVVLDNGIQLAVKHIWNLAPNCHKNNQSTAMLMKNSGNLPEFEAEVTTLSSIRHINVVKLYCSITSENSSLLVYEYLPNGSLWDRLHTRSDIKLDWETRYEIAVGAAKGLEYLHHCCERPVIHRDVKSSNILLDEFFKPRIADFGLAKIVQSNGELHSTHVITGTHGYIAPEYAYTCKVNEKSDVYSFGVVLMELVTGRKPIEPAFGDNKDIVNWICTRMAEGENIAEMVDSSIPDMLKEYAVKVLRTGFICTARLPASRPSMRTVVQMLMDAEPCKLVDIAVYENDGSEKDVAESVERIKHVP